MAKTNNLQFNKSPKLAYVGFLFQTFFKRPFGYIIGVLYVVYLAVILLIVPAAVKQHPLFIWNISAFNMPIFNLFFIAAATSSAAVAIFRVGREDGTDLALSAKPLTKGNTVAIKTIVYLAIMLMFSVIAIICASLIRPVFGEYHILDNPTGVTALEYRGLLLSVTIGNLVNMFVFGAISIFICMVGGQVITMIGTIAFAFVLSMMNFIYPQVVATATSYIEDHCNSQLLSFNANTVGQYFNTEDEQGTPFPYTAIQCFADDDGEEILPHFDTKVYWDIAKKETGTSFVNYIDLGKQLSCLYSSFGLEGLKLEDAKQLYIDCSPEYNYNVIPNTSPKDSDETSKNYPIAVYTTIAHLGKVFPIVNMVGTDVAIFDTTNWYIQSKYRMVDFDSICVLSKNTETFYHPTDIIDRIAFANKTWFKIKELVYTDEQKPIAEQMWQDFFKETRDDQQFRDWPMNQFKNGVGQGVLYRDVPFDELTWLEKYKAIGQLHLYWAILAQQEQVNEICTHIGCELPITSKDVLQWYDYLSTHSSDAAINSNLVRTITYGFTVCQSPWTKQWYYSRLVNSPMQYAETYTNLYQYTVSNFYSIPALISVWSILSVILLTSSIVVYKRTDFK